MPSPPAPDWAAVDEFVAAYEEVLGPLHRDIRKLLEEWNAELAEAGFIQSGDSSHQGEDPTYRDWRGFRALRHDHENDWTDWLAFLLKESTEGVLAWRLFGDGQGVASDYAQPKAVEREVTHEGHRCDLLIEWRHGSFAHMEVKTGDRDLKKTFETGKKMRLKKGAKPDKWSNFILLLSSQADAWASVPEAARVQGEPETQMKTWVDASIAVRQGLRSEKSAMWKGCAYIFAGAMEQKLVGYLGYTKEPFRNVAKKLKILREGRRRG